MPWNASVEAEYDALIASPIGEATDVPTWLLSLGVEPQLIELETGSASNLVVTPAHWSYLTSSERVLLFFMRVACALYVERNGLFPWRLADHSVAELRPLLSYHYQGLREGPSGQHKFHHVWDVEPGPRMAEAVLGYFLGVLFGADVPTTARDMVTHFIDWMRESGWGHMSGYYDDYADYPDHGSYVYDFQVFTEVKRSGCHGTADYISAGLRHYNVPAHYGRGWAGAQPSSDSAYWSNVHQHGHCFLHFPTEGWWLAHGDDVYHALWKTIPPSFAMMSDEWMHANHFGETEYTWSRGRAYESNFWWCLLIGQSSSPSYDVPTLYANGALRHWLENLHITYDLAARDGAPAVVPPVFDAEMVDALMGWVAYKLD
jgi:hypothetical protein